MRNLAFLALDHLSLIFPPRLTAPLPYPHQLITSARTISVVGNGPVAGDAPVDDADLVVRFNTAHHCGLAGHRTDILVLMNWSRPGYLFATRRNRINQLARRTARTFWMATHPDELVEARIDREAKMRGDYSPHIISRVIGARPYRFMPHKNRTETAAQLRQHGARSDVIPTTGAQAIHLLLNEAPKAQLHLYGFTHEGWPGHCWDAERRWVDSLQRVTAYT